MILLYTLLLFVLGAVKFLVGLRARALERKFVRVAGAVDQALRQPEYKPGNSNKPDACVSAKRMFLLGQLVQERDRVEAKHFAWQRWADRLAGWVRTVRNWKGMKLPYTLGAVDVSMLLYFVDYVGVGQYFSVAAVIESVAQLVSQ